MKLPLLAAAISSSVTIFACGPYIQPSYLSTPEPYTFYLNNANAFDHFLSTIKDLLPPPDKFPEGKSTMDAEIIDFNHAVQKFFPDISPEKKADLEQNFISLLAIHRDTGEIRFENPKLPEELAEFQLFLEGRSYLMKNAPDEIPEAWKKLLALPPEKRHYRTAWVHFMLGCHFKKDLHQHYENCRNAVRQGFTDTAGLARRSYILEVRFGEDILCMIKRELEAHNSGFYPNPYPDDHIHDSITDKDTICKILKTVDDGTYFALISDPVCRELLAISDPSPRFRTLVKNFKLRNADICAYYSYNNGDISEAREFIAIMEKPTLLSLYLEAKIARHDGNIPRAASKLRQWLKMVGDAPPADQEILKGESDGYGYFRFSKDVYGILGTSMIMRRDFTEAAKFFFQAEQETDVFEIAEKYMTLDELTSFTDNADKIPVKDREKTAWMLKELRHLTARRAFREGSYAVAEKYMPQEHLPRLKAFLEFSKRSKDTKLSNDERALALYNAAKILRHCGMELAGTQGEPDNFPGNLGNNIPGCTECKYDSTLGYWTLCDDHMKLTRQVPGFNAAKDYRSIPPHLRYHYRYLAAEMALKAGTLAEDQELRALIHCFGGAIFKKRSNMEADIFYKRLVLNSRKTQLSQLADRLRWFPNIPVLNKEIGSPEPCPSLDAVKELMKKAFHASR